MMKVLQLITVDDDAPCADLIINMLEGSARIRTQGTLVDAEAGFHVHHDGAMDANNVASGPPSEVPLSGALDN